MPGGRHRHKSQTQDSKDKGKKRRSSKENSYSPSPCSSCTDPSSPRSPTDDIDVMGMLSKYRVSINCFASSCYSSGTIPYIVSNPECSVGAPEV